MQIPPVRPRSDWFLPEGVTYLNHGSFGVTPRVVQTCREDWSRRLAGQPMNFYLREVETALDESAVRLGSLIGTEARNLLFTDNATASMNIVAATVPLQTGDEVLLNNHEYGAVRRIWQQACDRQQSRLVTAMIPTVLTSPDEIVDSLFESVTPRTKLIVVSHVTSPTALIFPVEEICRRARGLNIPVCIDGPHAIAMRDVNLSTLKPAFYCASLHKWLSAPLGTGFLYVHGGWQSKVESPLVSWGRSLSGRAPRWQDSGNWLGTRDPAGALAVPAAIDFLQQVGLSTFREHGHALARYARERIEQLFGTTCPVPDSPDWSGTMITIPLPEGPSLRPTPNSWDPWQQALWERHQIEVPLVDWQSRRHIRVSCHLYNSSDDIDRLVEALAELKSL